MFFRLVLFLCSIGAIVCFILIELYYHSYFPVKESRISFAAAKILESSEVMCILKKHI